MNTAMTLCLILFLDYRPFFEELYIEYNKINSKSDQNYFEEQTQIKQFFNQIIFNCQHQMEQRSPSQLYFTYLDIKLLLSIFTHNFVI